MNAVFLQQRLYYSSIDRGEFFAVGISKGFSNWKHGSEKLRKHKASDYYVEAHQVLHILPTQSTPIDELLDIGHASKKPENRRILLTILQNIRFLARQGLPLRGDGAASGVYTTYPG